MSQLDNPSKVGPRVVLLAQRADHFAAIASALEPRRFQLILVVAGSEPLPPHDLVVALFKRVEDDPTAFYNHIIRAKDRRRFLPVTLEPMVLPSMLSQTQHLPLHDPVPNEDGARLVVAIERKLGLAVPSRPGALDIFISYAKGDKPDIDEIALALERHGLNVWYDANIDPGHNWTAEIEANLGRAELVVTFWSPLAATSAWVNEEALFAFERGKYLGLTLKGSSQAVPLVLAPKDKIPLVMPAHKAATQRKNRLVDTERLVSVVADRLGIKGLDLVPSARLAVRRSKDKDWKVADEGGYAWMPTTYSVARQKMLKNLRLLLRVRGLSPRTIDADAVSQAIDRLRVRLRQLSFAGCINLQKLPDDILFAIHFVAFVFLPFVVVAFLTRGPQCVELLDAGYWSMHAAHFESCARPLTPSEVMAAVAGVIAAVALLGARSMAPASK